MIYEAYIEQLLTLPSEQLCNGMVSVRLSVQSIDGSSGMQLVCRSQRINTDFLATTMPRNVSLSRFVPITSCCR